MSVSASSPTAAYQQSSVLTAPPERLVVMLYDGARRFLSQASIAMGRGDAPAAHQRLLRAEDIINELLATLDHERGGEVASRLQGVYVFCLKQLSDARVRRDADTIDHVGELLGELREAWAEIGAAA